MLKTMLRTKFSSICSALFIATALTAAAAAQVTAGFEAGPEAQVMTAVPKMGVSTSADFGEAAAVKGAPFCAVITTEHTQVFADGNRIHTSDSSTLCRDSEGRTRRETRLNLLGAAAQQGPPMLTTIVDPVAGFRYVLDANNKTARRMPLLSKATADKGAGRMSTAGPGPGEPGPHLKGDNVMFFRTLGDPEPDVPFGTVFVNRETGEGGAEPATENLGDQTIEDIHATGTRMTTTIPAGKMGNEQPILVTSERWYSPELKATIMTKHNDPWAGELKTQFTSVNTAEPDSSLFAVPADYKVVDEKGGPFTIKLPPPAPPAQ